MTRDDAINAMHEAISKLQCAGKIDEECVNNPNCPCRRDGIIALSALESIGIAIVPVEPTAAMIAAGHEQADESEGGFSEYIGAAVAKTVWRAMLSASPLRPSPLDGETEHE